MPNRRAGSLLFVFGLFLSVRFPSGVSAVNGMEHLIGLRIETGDESPVKVRENNAVVMRVFGLALTPETRVSFTYEVPSTDKTCLSAFLAQNVSYINSNSLLVFFRAPPVVDNGSRCYLCLSSGNSVWRHQGEFVSFTVSPHKPKGLSPWLLAVAAILLLGTSGLFSGLTLGLLTLNMSELQVISTCGTQEEKNYATKIIPLRRRGNYLLCSLILGNVFINNVFTVYIESQLPDGIGLTLATVGIVIFGEILPQALCSRYGLAIGAGTSMLTRIIMLLTSPISYPASLVLDRALGKELPSMFDRAKLAEYLRLVRTDDIKQEEMNIIFGALELSQKTAQEIMTRIEDVFMLPYEALLDFETIAEIVRRGYTRVPVFKESRQNIVGLLHTKDLALVAPGDALPLKLLLSFYKHPVCYTHASDPIGLPLTEFRKGRSHMAMVRTVTEGSGDNGPNSRIIGILTLEDVIEEIIQAEINDETDTLTDNRRRLRRWSTQVVVDFEDFIRVKRKSVLISPQLAFATFQYLATAIPEFDERILKASILRKLLPSDGLYFAAKFGQVICSKKETQDSFLLILEGKVQVTLGQESLQFESGPFTYFGAQALKNLDDPQCDQFEPDYTIVVSSDKVIYMKLNRQLYKKAVRLSKAID
ncbi:metal transporter CNNM4-like [Tropilaelaps mercedesae]|uniref:Metal transporter CNNM4-like n=1 Tax=Tropilaelaps mercedesae TaxID=418985 RepID=A0A1V9XM96_9ACAR|nr:metal transporter CNNM4-like [Tropilaelaps mercedesae]